MKRCKLFTCWTDYPIVDLGDIEGKQAPYRRVVVYSYDANKLALVKVKGDQGIFLEIKIGYLYSSPNKLHYEYNEWWNKTVNPRKFERMISTKGEQE